MECHAFPMKYTSVSFLSGVALLMSVAICFQSGAVASSPSVSPADDTVIEIDATGQGRPFQHSWEQSFGSDRADMVLTESYLRNAETTKAATDFQYVRFHGIFADTMGILAPDAAGHINYNFRKVDAVYDSLLRRHIRPFVELSFMPSLLGSNLLRRNGGLEPLVTLRPEDPVRQITDYSGGTLWYRANVSPPARMAAWNDLIRAFVTHLEQRYGRDEVRQWPFEVWNEPDQATWTGNPKKESYFALYDNTARTIKAVDPEVRVGGPSTGAIHWVGDFVHHVAQAHVPADFVSTHIYANDPPNLLRLPKSSDNSGNTVCDATRTARKIINQSDRPGLPLYISEFGADWDIHNGTADRSWVAPWLAETIRECDGLAPIMSYWTFSDDFEEQGVLNNELPGAYGLLTTHGIPKPAFNAFALLHHLGSRRLATRPASADALATRTSEGKIAVAVWNRSPNRSRNVTLDLHGAATTTGAMVTVLDRQHGSPSARFAELGRPETPTDSQTKALIASSKLPTPEPATGCVRPDFCTLVLPPESVALLVIPKRPDVPKHG